MEVGRAEACCEGMQVAKLLLLLPQLTHPLGQDAAAKVGRLKRRFWIVSHLVSGKGLVDLKPISREVPAKIQWTQACPKTCRWK